MRVNTGAYAKEKDTKQAFMGAAQQGELRMGARVGEKESRSARWTGMPFGLSCTRGVYFFGKKRRLKTTPSRNTSLVRCFEVKMGPKLTWEMS